MMEERWPLPVDWRWAQASEIGRIVGGGTPSTGDPTNFTDGDGTPWITPADLTGYERTYISRGRRNLSKKGLASCGATLMPAGTVLYSSRAPIGYCAIAENPISTNQGFKSLVVGKDVVPEFVRYYLLSSKEYAEGLASGTTFKELSGSRMAQLPIPIAPKDEQRRIVAKLDGLLARSKNARDELAHIPMLVARYKKAVLAAAFRGNLTADWRASAITGDTPGRSNRKWETKPLSELCDYRRGITYGVIKLGDEIANGVPCLRTSNVRWLRFDLEGMKRISPTLSSEYGRTVLKGGEVLVNVRGTLGGVAVATQEMAGWNVSREVAMVPIDNSQVDSEFLAYWIGSAESQEWLTGVKKGVAYTGINLEDLRKLPVDVPSIDEQFEIVRRVREIFSQIDSLLNEATRATALAKRLDQAILAKAFRGDLATKVKTVRQKEYTD